MTTPHEFAVNGSGSATVSVPIKVAPGIAGMEPQLSLSYSSDGGNGLLGIGWVLSGMSVLTRCGQNYVHDGQRSAVTFGRGDRFCLDGQRLLLVSPAGNPDDVQGTAGSEYRTEIESHARITALDTLPGGANTPMGWRVENKAGLTLYFGGSENALVRTNIPERSASAQLINRWLLRKIEDRNGNSVDFFYCAGDVLDDGARCTEGQSAAWSGSKLPHYIRYTGRADRPGSTGVLFVYENRPDKQLSFHAGSSSEQRQRLKSIRTFTSFSGPSAAERGQLVRRYELSYEALTNASTGAALRATRSSRLATIQESGRDGTALPPLSFSYTPDLLWGRGIAHNDSGGLVRPPIDMNDCGLKPDPRYPRQQLCP